jgi:hypothetical protein
LTHVLTLIPILVLKLHVLLTLILYHGTRSFTRCRR